MPFITSKKLVGLQVFTESGIHLGKVADLEIDTEAQSVQRYIVKGRLGGIINKELIVGAAEVVFISSEKMVVRDGIEAAFAAQKRNPALMESGTSGISMSKD